MLLITPATKTCRRGFDEVVPGSPCAISA